ncbi:MAG: helix-turn-helix domain-containing protein [Flavobacteriaceae bacterium]
MENYITIDSVGTYFKLRNYELLHPLIGVLNFDNFKPDPNAVPVHDGFNFACYAIFLKDNKSVSEIAYELGFRYPQHFSRLFKSKVGYSPKKFRFLN